MHMKQFFAQSETLDYFVLRPLSHIRANWDLYWEGDAYCEEDDSFAGLLNQFIDEIANARPPARYHDNEDTLAEFARDHMKWPIRKVGSRWEGLDYHTILQDGGLGDIGQQDLVMAAAGRVRAAMKRGQLSFDDMEESHRDMLGTVMAIILYHRDMSTH